jgi:alpha-tubulin suppressor-like RCC1 family protein
VPIGTEESYEAVSVWTNFNIVGGTPRGCWAEISAGGYHTLAIAQDGTLWAWGDNNNKQLGNNSAVTYQTTPVQISSERNWMFVSAGEYYSLAIKKDGTLWAWGRNDYGQLGDGTTTQRNTPVQIGTDTNWLSVSAGYHHSMAIKTNNTLWAWGRNSNGQIGNNSTTQQNTPVQVGTATDWAAVKPGRNHTLALKSNGQLWSWGQNSFGQLGQGNYTNSSVPVQVGTATDWKSIHAGDYHSLVLKTNGTIWTWGDNASGQLGIGNTTEQTSPVQVGNATDWKFITSGAFHGYAIKTNGTLWAWGDNYFGQLGNGNFAQQNSPVQIGADTDWYSIFAGDYYGVSQKSNGNFLSWGDNQTGQLGNGNTTPNTTGQNIPGTMNCAGNVLNFDGVDDRVVIQNLGTGVLGDNSNNDSYTVQLKVKTGSVGEAYFVSKKETTPTNKGYAIGTDASGKLYFDQAYGGVFKRVQTSAPLAANTWYTISATFDFPNKTHKLYVNAIEVGTFTDVASPVFTTLNFEIGFLTTMPPTNISTFINDIVIATGVAPSQIIVSYVGNARQANVQSYDLLVHYQFNQGIANANNAGITTMQNEVFGSPYVGTLENFALNGTTSNWSYDVTAFETLNRDNFSITDNIKVYPNPSTGIFKITLENEAAINVFDLVGKQIYSGKATIGESTIDISNHQSGIYLLNVKTENGSLIKKVIKE